MCVIKRIVNIYHYYYYYYTLTEVIFFILFRAGGRNVSRRRQEKPRTLERHHARLARDGQVHAQSAGRAAQQVLSGHSDV